MVLALNEFTPSGFQPPFPLRQIHLSLTCHMHDSSQSIYHFLTVGGKTRLYYTKN